MIKACVLLACFSLMACDFKNKEQTRNNSVTDGKLVLGLVPIKNGANGDTQRYRLLVCKKQPKYTATMFADKSICRSGLQTNDGREVDFTGTKLENPSLVHLDAEKAAEVKKLGFSPTDISNQVRNKHIAKVSAIAMGVITAGVAVATTYMAKVDADKVIGLVGGAITAGTGILTLYFAKEASADVNTEKQVLPKAQSMSCPVSGGIFPRVCAPVYNRADTITSEQWHNINTQDFSHVESLEHSGDIRLILTSMAKTFQLKLNEDSLLLK